MEDLFTFTLSSLGRHFTDKLPTYSLWFEGEEEVDDVDFEIRFDGPTIIAETGSHYTAGLELDLVAKAPATNYSIYTKVGKLFVAANQGIQLTNDALTSLGCFIPDAGQPTVKHYGKLTPSINLMVSVVRCRYRIEVTK